ncbi:MAG TPA: nitrite reductase small subunit NirD [Rhodoblastus sp.]|nr:nitrite reductase small subunit NirD [Rhodoblastus sp.]
MIAWYDIGALDEVAPLAARKVRIGDKQIAVFRTADDQVFAVENKCPHRGGPLADGIVHGHKVTCPLHNWVIDLKTGEATGADEGCAHAFAIEVVGGRIRLGLPAAVAAE